MGLPQWFVCTCRRFRPQIVAENGDKSDFIPIRFETTDPQVFSTVAPERTGRRKARGVAIVIQKRSVLELSASLLT